MYAFMYACSLPRSRGLCPRCAGGAHHAEMLGAVEEPMADDKGDRPPQQQRQQQQLRQQQEQEQEQAEQPPVAAVQSTEDE